MTDVVVGRTIVRRLDAAIVSFNVFAITTDIDVSDTIGCRCVRHGAVAGRE